MKILNDKTEFRKKKTFLTADIGISRDFKTSRLIRKKCSICLVN